MPSLHPKVVLALTVVGVAAAYWLAGTAGLELALVRGQVSPLWPASGVALFCLVQWGWRAVPGVLAGALLVNLSFGPSAASVLVIAVGNTVAPLGAWLLLRRVGFRPDLRRVTDVVTLIVLGGLAGMTLSATLGSSALVLTGGLPAAEFWTTWTVWWAGDAMGVLMVAPVLFALWHRRPRLIGSQRRRVEAAVILTCTVGAAVLSTASPVDVLFPTIIPLVWAAVRFQLIGAAPVALTISVITTLAAAEGSGPFAGYDVVPLMIMLQVFNGSLALVALLLSAALSERNQALAVVEETCGVLADAVTKLSDDTGLGERTLAAVRRAAELEQRHDDEDSRLTVHGS